MVKPITPEGVPLMRNTRYLWQVHEYASEKQIAKLKHLLRAKGIFNKPDAEAYVNDLLQTEVADWTQLSKRAVSYLIETLEKKEEQQ